MFNKIRLLTVAALTAFATVPAHADDFISADVHVLYSPGSDFVTGTGEYSWVKGKWSGYGFLDVLSEGSLHYLTDHNANYAIADRFFLSAEVGRSNFGNTVKFGAGINLSLPGMVYTSVTLYPIVEGNAGVQEQISFSWQTKELSIVGPISVYHSGFADISDDAPIVFQPQVWLKHADWERLEIGAEMSMFGDEQIFQAALKFNF